MFFVVRRHRPCNVEGSICAWRPRSNCGTGQLEAAQRNTIPACSLRKLHFPSTHHAAVVSRLFDQGKHVRLNGLLGRCNGNQPVDLVTVHRYVRCDVAEGVHGSVRYKTSQGCIRHVGRECEHQFELICVRASRPYLPWHTLAITLSLICSLFLRSSARLDAVRISHVLNALLRSSSPLPNP